MPFYSDEIIEQVRSSNDIVDVIGQYVHLKKKGSSYFGLCPFHNEKSPSFSVSRQKQMYYCFGCGAGGNVIRFLMDYENLTFPEALQELASRSGIELPRQEMTAEARREADRKSQLLEINKLAAKYFYSLLHSERGKRAMDYFIGRELSPETMQKFGLGYSDQYSDDLYKYLRKQGYSDAILKDSGLVTIDEVRGGRDKFWNRAMFPILDANSKVIAFGGRVMGEGEPKYLNSPETPIFNKSRNLFGLYLAKKTKRKQFILCEGYMDVIALHQAGFDNAVASLGTALTSGHAALIKRYTDAVYLSYDSDGAGVKAALRAIPILREAGITCKIINMRPYKDPDEFMKNLGPEEYEKRIEEAENSFLFSIRMMEADFDMNDPAGKTAFQKAIAKRILEFPEEIERNNYIEAVALAYQFPIDSLRQLVVHLAAQEGSGITAARPATRPKATNFAKQQLNREDGPTKSQMLLLTWIAEDVAIYHDIKNYISPEDFNDGILRQVAAALFAQIEAGEGVNPAKISSSFTEEEQQRQVAKMFNTPVAEDADTSAKDLSKALKETVIRIKEESLERQRKAADPSQQMKLLREQKDIIASLKKHDFYHRS